MRWKPREWTLVSVLLLVVPGAMTVRRWLRRRRTRDNCDYAGHRYGVSRGRDTGDGYGDRELEAFTTASGQSVPSGNTSATIAGGALSIALAPNAGATPMGSYYTAVYHLDDGSVSREYWVVPVSQFPVPVSAIKSQVLPTSVAMQTVSKSYVDTAIAAAVTGHPLDSSTPYVLKAGDTMTGPLVLPADPTSPLQAADKHYVDINVARGGWTGAEGFFAAFRDSGGGQPTGTQLQVNSEWRGVCEPVHDRHWRQWDCECAGESGLREWMRRGGGASYASTESYGSTTDEQQPSGGTHVEDTGVGSGRQLYESE